MPKSKCTVFVYLPGETDAVPAGVLAPAFDVTPTASVQGISSIPRLSMAPGLMGKEASLENLLSAVGEFGLSMEEGEALFSQCVDIVRTNWRKEFQRFNVSEEDAKKFHDTFSAYENIYIQNNQTYDNIWENRKSKRYSLSCL